MRRRAVNLDESGSEEFEGVRFQWNSRPPGAPWKGGWMVWVTLNKTFVWKGNDLEVLKEKARSKIRKFNASPKDTVRRHYRVVNDPEAASPEEIDAAAAYFEAQVELVKKGRETAEQVLEYIESPAFQEEATRLASLLDNATDNLNASLKRLEAVLVERFRGRCASVELDARHALLFWQSRGKWGLFVVNDRGAINPVVHQTRETRILAVQGAENLVEMLKYEDE